jgi:hypothetical protein
MKTVPILGTNQPIPAGGWVSGSFAGERSHAREKSVSAGSIACTEAADDGNGRKKKMAGPRWSRMTQGGQTDGATAGKIQNA